jgi:hypothetical protein
VADQDKIPQWNGTITEEDGIKVIKNPREPLYGELTFELEEDLSIGNEEDDNSYFYKSIKVDVDGKGNIYVLDRANYRIQKFDKNGNYILTCGRKGQGPGEFLRMSGFHVDKNNRICVLDRGRIHVFNESGELEFCTSIDNYCTQISLADNGGIIGRVSSRIAEGIQEEIVLLNREGKQLKSYISSFYPVFRKMGMSTSGASMYAYQLYFNPWTKGSAIYCHSSNYRLFFIDSSGSIMFIAEKEEHSEVITRNERNEFYKNRFEAEKEMSLRSPNREPLSMNEIKKAYPIPEYKPFFSRLFTDNDGNVFILKMIPMHPKERLPEFDLFDSNGYYVHRVKMPYLPVVIKGGNVFRVRWDQEKELFRIKRYKIKNWDQIRVGI